MPLVRMERSGGIAKKLGEQGKTTPISRGTAPLDIASKELLESTNQRQAGFAGKRKEDMNKEAEMCKALVEQLLEQEHEVFQEVTHLFGRSDIVTKRGNILWAIEAKTTLSMALLEQAIKSKESYHYVSIFVPRTNGSAFAKRICKQYGIGVITAKDYGKHGGFNIMEEIKPALNRKALTKRIRLEEEHKTFAIAGNDTGSFWSPFKRTCRNLENLVARKGKVPFKEAIKEIDHHYASLGSAAQSLKMWIGTKHLPDLELDKGWLQRKAA